MSEGFAPRNRQESVLFALTRGDINDSGYCFAPMSDDNVRRVADLFRRSKARRRRGVRTKPARRAPLPGAPRGHSLLDRSNP